MLRLRDRAPLLTLDDHTGRPTELADLWRDRPLVLLFIRHFGCPFCREHLADVRDRYREFVDAGGEVAAVTMGTPERAAAFREQHRLPFTCFADRQQRAYAAFGVPRGNWSQVAGPGVWAAGIKAIARAGFGKPVGDIQQLHAEFVIDMDGIVRMAFLPKHSAEHAPMEDILALLRSLSAAPADGGD